MQITDLVVKRLERAVDSRLWNPTHRWSVKPLVLVFLTTDSGLTGVGEAFTAGGAGEALEQSLINDVKPLVVGRSAFEVRDIWRLLMRKVTGHGLLGPALSAVDIAVWDLIGQHAGLPLHRMFGTASTQIFTYASAGLYADGKGLDELAEEMAGYVADGFDAVKMKIGGASLEEDEARVRRVRETIGPTRRLMIDASSVLTPRQARDYALRLAPLDIHFFEAPIAIPDVGGLAELKTVSPIAITTENQFGLAAYERHTRARAADNLQMNVTLSGGLTECFRIAALATAANMACTFQCAGSFVSLAATLQFAAALDNCDSVEMHMVHQWLPEYATGDEYRRDGSYLTPGMHPGIGLGDDARQRLMQGS